ncbi:MAG: hypothetical protein KTR18_15505 [Acidiferrobacterales bacterium]|nr:hypothetical protein [Acidiferrobacterales bacterium]
MKPTTNNVTKPIRSAAKKKATKKEVAPTEVVYLSRSMFTNGQYCAAIRVERSSG